MAKTTKKHRLCRFIVGWVISAVIGGVIHYVIHYPEARRWAEGNIRDVM